MVPAGHEMAREQFKVGGNTYFDAADIATAGQLNVSKKGDSFSFQQKKSKVFSIPKPEALNPII